MGALPDPGPRDGADPETGTAAAPPEQPELRAVPDAPPRGPESAGPQQADDPEAGERPAWWEHLLRPPDVWNRPAPALAEEVARVRAGDHLPESGPWRRAEQVRSWISVVIIAALLLAIEANRSAGRQALTLLIAAALYFAFVH